MKVTQVLPIALVLGLSLPIGVMGAESKVDFANDIKPILEQSCIKCHGPEKQKGKLRLDTKEAAFKKEGNIVAGAPDKSDLYKRVMLPKGHDDVMPPEGDTLPKEKTELLKEWIVQGAVWPEGLTAGVGTPAGGAAKPKSGVEALGEHKPSPAELQTVEKLATTGVNVVPVAMNLLWRDANLSLLGTNITDQTLAQMKDIAGLVYLDLRNTKVTDAGLSNLKSFPNLLRLNLSGTSVTDEGLKQLQGLSKLEYLNVYNTAVSDAGLAALKDLKSLRALYLWQTKVTDAGAADLQKALPGLKMNRGIDLAAMAKKEEEKKKEEKPAEKKDEKKEEKK